MQEKANDKINRWTERLIALLITIIICVVSTMYYEQRRRIETLETNVSFLYQDKVSKADLREEIERIRIQNDANKSDIISRIDFLIRYVQPSHLEKK